MKIGFDVSQTGKSKAGCGYFADSLLQHLAALDRQNEYILYPTFGDFFFDPDWSAITDQRRQANFRRGKAPRTLEAARVFWNNPAADFEKQLGYPEVIHANNFYCPVGLKQARLVYTLYDLSFISHPEWTTEANRVGCFNGVFNASLHADRIVAISEFSRRHFLATFPHYPPERITVIHLASRFTKGLQLAKPPSMTALQPDQFWLSVGTLEPRKNQQRLLQAYARLRKEGTTCFPLVLAGGAGWMMDDFTKQAELLGVQRDVTLTGYVDDDALQWLYQNCFAFVYPSLFEGFGLPVLEAMSQGAAAITSDCTSLTEITGDAGLLVDPLSEESICQAMRRLSQDHALRSSLQTKAKQQASGFSWTNAAREMLKVYAEVMIEDKYHRS